MDVIAVHEKFNWIISARQCNTQVFYTQVFFSSVKPTLIMLLQDKKYSMRGAYLAEQPNITNLYNFWLICANVGVLFSFEILLQACKKHLQTPFSLKHAISVLKYYTVRNVIQSRQTANYLSC